MVALSGAHVAEALALQVDELVISANRHLEQWRASGYPVFRDIQEGKVSGAAGRNACCDAAGREPMVCLLPLRHAVHSASFLVERFIQQRRGTHRSFGPMTANGIILPLH